MVELALIVWLLFDCNLERRPLSLYMLFLSDSSVSDKKKIIINNYFAVASQETLSSDVTGANSHIVCCAVSEHARCSFYSLIGFSLFFEHRSPAVLAFGINLKLQKPQISMQNSPTTQKNKTKKNTLI